MEAVFQQLTPISLNRAYLFNGSVGPAFHDFRFRIEQDEKEKLIHAAAYSKVCYEKADDVEKRDFPWDESGVAELREWLQAGYEAFCAREGNT